MEHVEIVFAWIYESNFNQQLAVIHVTIERLFEFIIYWTSRRKCCLLNKTSQLPTKLPDVRSKPISQQTVEKIQFPNYDKQNYVNRQELKSENMSKGKISGDDARTDETVPSLDGEHNRALSLRKWGELIARGICLLRAWQESGICSVSPYIQYGNTNQTNVNASKAENSLVFG